MDNLLGEFIGTVVLMSFGCGVNANVNLAESKAKGGGWICITVGWGFAVMLGVFTATALGAPQGDLNPAVTLAKTFAGVYTPIQFAMTAAAQILAAIVGATIVWLAYLPHWERTEASTQLGVFVTGPAIRNVGANFLCEVIATFFLMFVIWTINAKANGTLPPGTAPYLVGMLIWGLGLSFGGPTGYAMNPARDLGPRIAYTILPISGKGSADWAYSWIPIAAPLFGATLAYFVASTFNIL